MLIYIKCPVLWYSYVYSGNFNMLVQFYYDVKFMLEKATNDNYVLYRESGMQVLQSDTSLLNSTSVSIIGFIFDQVHGLSLFFVKSTWI